MNSYPENPEFREFMEVFRNRYVVESEDGQRVIAMTSEEALLLSKYLFRGLIDWMATPKSETTSQLSLGKSLKQFAARNAEEPNLNVRITEEDLNALGMFLLQGLVGVILTVDQSRMATAPESGKHVAH
jgi:hypothetical protein